METFRYLTAKEVECRVATCNEKGVSLLLYKDARCDMRILDETVGAKNWKRHHDVVNGNLFCTVSIWDEDKKEWIDKQDVGKESNAEKEKGQASDSFKRACVNWGIGRELYTSPFIWIPSSKVKMEQYKGKWTTNDKFKVKEMVVEQGEIKELVISNEKTSAVVFSYGSGNKTQTKPEPKSETKPQTATEAQLKRLWAVAGKAGVEESGLHEFIQKAFKKQSIKELTSAEVDAICKRLESR